MNDITKPLIKVISPYCITCRHDAKPESIAFNEVKEGDLIYHDSYYMPNKWREVTGIEYSKDYVTLNVGLSVCKNFDTRNCFVGHKLEGINVKRCTQ